MFSGRSIRAAGRLVSHGQRERVMDATMFFFPLPATAARTVKNRLDLLGIPSRLVDYGNGTSLSPQCDGSHTYGCWGPAYADYVPRLEAAFETAAEN